MFTRDALIADLPRLLAAAPLPLDFVSFRYDEFNPPASEQSIDAMRGSKQVFDSGIRFWVDAVRAQDWAGREDYLVRYLNSSLCAPINRREFEEVINGWTWSLQKPLPMFLTDLNGFQAG